MEIPSNPFVVHLDHVLSAYELTPHEPLPRYDGPSTPQTENILRVLSTIVRRAYTAEIELEGHRKAQDWGRGGPQPKKRRSVSSLGKSFSYSLPHLRRLRR